MRRTRHKFQSRWSGGVYLGVKEESIEKIVGNKDSVFVVQSMTRKPEGDRYGAFASGEIRGLPWEPSPKTDRPG